MARQICAERGCKTRVPPGRRKYCSSECQIKAARRKTRQWRARRKTEEKEERELNIPPRTRRYRIREGTEIWSYMYDPELKSYRNPHGSKYVEELIKEIDKRWPGDEIEGYQEE